MVGLVFPISLYHLPLLIAISFLLENNKNLSDIGMDVYIRNIIKEMVKEEVDNKFYSTMCKIAEEKAVENIKTLTAKELCKRWNISDNTLRNKENQGIIRPLENGGKKKIYSMKDILNVESTGMRR